MNTALIAVLIVVAVGLVYAFIDGGKQNARREAELRALFAQLFPDGRLELWPLCRGGIGARLKIDGKEYVLEGCYLRGEGGDGFLHIHQQEEDRRKEIGRVSLSDDKFHWAVLTKALRRLSEYLQKEKPAPNQPLEGTPGKVPSSSTESGARRPSP